MEVKQLKGETENFYILGNTVESAIQATKEALYDLEYPKVYTPRSIEVQQVRIPGVLAERGIGEQGWQCGKNFVNQNVCMEVQNEKTR